MQLTEIKNDLATINYSPELNRLMLSDFILIEDANQSILAQIISIEATMEDDVNSAMLKFLLSIDKDANLTQYTGYVPAKNATLILINPQEVIQLIKNGDKNLLIGNLASYPDIPVEISIDFFRRKPYIQVDSIENKREFTETIIKGLEKYNKKIVLFDFSGLYSGIKIPNLVLGKNFKLPLNYDALCYIAEEELNDCGGENKAFIQGILLEIQNYVKSTDDGFIPFDTFISVLDSQYEESSIPELLLLKNKLVKYHQQGIFAQSKSEFNFLNSFLKENKTLKIDLSGLPSQWHKIAFASILDIISTKCYLITDCTEENTNKTIIKKLYEKNEIKPIVISSYNYKYQLQLKALSKNMVLFKPVQKVNDFAGYTSFLNILSHDNFIIWGEQTLFIPLILKISNVFRRFETTTSKENIINEKVIAEKDENMVVVENDEEISNIPDKEQKPAYEDIEEAETTTELIPEENTKITEENKTTIQDEIIEPDNEIPVNEISNSDNEDNTLTFEEIDDTKLITPYEQDNVTADNIQEETQIENLEILNEESQEEVNQDNFQNEPMNDLPNSEDLDFFFEEEQQESSDTTEPEISESLESFEIPESPEISEIQEKPEIAKASEILENSDTNDEQIENILEAEQDITETEEVTETVNDLENIELDENLKEIENTIEPKNIEDITLKEPVEAEKIENILEIDDTEQEQNIPEENVPEESTNIQEQIEETLPIQDIQEEIIEKEQEPVEIPTAKIEIKSSNIPVYNSEVAPQFDTKFAQGTYVHHPKYGRGVVEKVIKYGSKQLCLIIFDNEGRKLLDPTIADLKQA